MTTVIWNIFAPPNGVPPALHDASGLNGPYAALSHNSPGDFTADRGRSLLLIETLPLPTDCRDNVLPEAWR